MDTNNLLKMSNQNEENLDWTITKYKKIIRGQNQITSPANPILLKSFTYVYSKGTGTQRAIHVTSTGSLPKCQ